MAIGRLPIPINLNEAEEVQLQSIVRFLSLPHGMHGAS